MKDKSIFYLITLLLFVAICGSVLDAFGLRSFDNLAKIASVTGRLGALVLTVYEGTTMETPPYWQPILLFGVVTIAGVVFKIMHWPLGLPMLLSGLSIVTVLYSVRYVFKQNKTILDLLKLLWILSLLISVILKLEHWPYGEVAITVQSVLFIAVFVSFYLQDIKANKQISPSEIIDAE